MTAPASVPTGVALGRVDRGGARPALSMQRLNAIIGRWINEGHTINPDGTPRVKILASDVYEWGPGWLLRRSPRLRSHWRHQRRRSRDHRLRRCGTRNTRSTSSTARAISAGTTSPSKTALDLAGGAHSLHRRLQRRRKTQTAHHERTDDGVNWVPSMDVTLRKVE